MSKMAKPTRVASANPQGAKRSAAGRPKPKKKKPASLKNQIRAIERLLRKEGLDARIQKKEQARLQQLKEAAQAHKAQELERKYAVRYHKIRFFERVKFERRIKQLEREIKSDAPSTDGDLCAKLAQARDDLQYVVHFPKGEKYVSLLRNAEDPEAQKVLEAERKRIRAKVRQQQADIAMISQPDEGNPRPRQQPPQPPASPTPHQDMPKLGSKVTGAGVHGKAALNVQSSKRKAVTADLPEQPLLKSSKVLSSLATDNAGSSAPLQEAGKQTAGALGTDREQQKDGVAASDADADDIEEDDFFMSSSADEAEQLKQPAALQLPSELPAAAPQAALAEQQHPALKTMPPQHSKQRRAMSHSRKAPTSQHSAGRGHKPQPRGALPPPQKPMKQVPKSSGGAKQAVRSDLRVDARSQPSKPQPHGKAPSANANKQSPGAAPDKRAGQPLRTRAEGGRKRRK